NGNNNAVDANTPQDNVVDNGNTPQDNVVDNGNTQDNVVDNGNTQDNVVDNGNTQDNVVDNGNTQDNVVDNGNTQDNVVDNGNTPQDNANNGATDGAANGGDTTAADGQTLVFFEVNGVPGNECLTFRNNGEIVDAACVNTAIDRQITPTTLNGQNVLRVQRTFTAGFRPDLVNVEACVGFNGTAFRAEDCNAQGIEFVTFNNGELTASGGACASGHDDLAQVTVDTTGNTCATFTTTVVQPATA
ncbi:hypothetical protein BGZ61DRAFT_394236, partial [Ilyonectria robusta]|uniref:uncharacterized protein n=1 Tax=Ilyonectria robusta TaxID=1079257 RepID=UPI001E8DEDF6